MGAAVRSLCDLYMTLGELFSVRVGGDVPLQRLVSRMLMSAVQAGL